MRVKERQLRQVKLHARKKSEPRVDKEPFEALHKAVESVGWGVALWGVLVSWEASRVRQSDSQSVSLRSLCIRQAAEHKSRQCRGQCVRFKLPLSLPPHPPPFHAMPQQSRPPSQLKQLHSARSALGLPLLTLSLQFAVLGTHDSSRCLQCFEVSSTSTTVQHLLCALLPFTVHARGNDGLQWESISAGILHKQ